MNQEQTFFERLAGTNLPGWDVKLQPHMSPAR